MSRIRYEMILISAFIIILMTFAGCSEETITAEPFVDHTGETGTVTDIDGNVYTTIGIGGQIWMAENLKVTRYRNGDEIPEVQDYLAWYALTTPGRCSYNNDPANSVTFGQMYNWQAVSDTRKISPEGWHMPSDDEWDALINWVGGPDSAGVKLKETGFVHWAAPNEGASNESGFTALPGGWRINMGNFYDLTTRGYWWTISNDYLPSSMATAYGMYNDSVKVEDLAIIRNFGLYARCVKD
ncbi:MAG: fibrobacter succinogenes major paralogous domain-containing protein [Candidatus Delongbacteria bacterium]